MAGNNNVTPKVIRQKVLGIERMYERKDIFNSPIYKTITYFCTKPADLLKRFFKNINCKHL